LLHFTVGLRERTRKGTRGREGGSVVIFAFNKFGIVCV